MADAGFLRVLTANERAAPREVASFVETVAATDAVGEGRLGNGAFVAHLKTKTPVRLMLFTNELEAAEDVPQVVAGVELFAVPIVVNEVVVGLATLFQAPEDAVLFVARDTTFL